VGGCPANGFTVYIVIDEYDARFIHLSKQYNVRPIAWQYGLALEFLLPIIKAWD
jgi:hypothetical protein